MTEVMHNESQTGISGAGISHQIHANHHWMDKYKFQATKLLYMFSYLLLGIILHEVAKNHNTLKELLVDISKVFTVRLMRISSHMRHRVDSICPSPPSIMILLAPPFLLPCSSMITATTTSLSYVKPSPLEHPCIRHWLSFV